MEKLTMESTFKKGKYANKSVADLVKIDGEIFSMIKNGYEFDDEVLEAAHIKRSVRDVKVYCRVGGGNCDPMPSALPKETASIKQILSDINTLDKIGEDVGDGENNESMPIDYENEVDTINIDNFDSEDE